ncbi:P2X purinoceptor 7-like [Bufo gargarizans]|uniref:P2X purinoceptor 7-like n=1 Tax=Bufo gargarizans TaxID=30331 RepID=UPI001CF5C9BB|nr:P2X purinoceptor 7-like [Bufo gargarizans]XP_044141610.1 P2X purinoceptor 7-like [Bufo gargarizans]
MECFPHNPTRRGNEQFIEFDEEPEDTRVGNTNWCTCSKCHIMPTYVESICCQEIQNAEPFILDCSCITLHEYFNLYCQREELLNINLRALGQVRTPPADRDLNRIRRKTAYRFFTTWVHGYLGVGNRKPIPSCAVYLIRNTFPDPEDHYMGFKESSNYPAEFLALE